MRRLMRFIAILALLNAGGAIGVRNTWLTIIWLGIAIAAFAWLEVTIEKEARQ